MNLIFSEFISKFNADDKPIERNEIRALKRIYINDDTTDFKSVYSLVLRGYLEYRRDHFVKIFLSEPW
jgi:hypothetical protein